MFDPPSTCLIEGHKSYPAAVEELKEEHHVVVHEDGFRNGNRKTTNLIEGLWSLYQYKTKVKKGVKRITIQDTLEEF